MADMNKHMMAIGGLLLALFLLMVITGVTYVGGGYLKETICEQASSGYTWSNGVCYTNSSLALAATVTAVTKVTAVEAVVDIVLGLLALIVIVSLFAVVIKAAKGFSSSF